MLRRERLKYLFIGLTDALAELIDIRLTVVAYHLESIVSLKNALNKTAKGKSGNSGTRTKFCGVEIRYRVPRGQVAGEGLLLRLVACR